MVLFGAAVDYRLRGNDGGESGDVLCGARGGVDGFLRGGFSGVLCCVGRYVVRCVVFCVVRCLAGYVAGFCCNKKAVKSTCFTAFDNQIVMALTAFSASEIITSIEMG